MPAFLPMSSPRWAQQPCHADVGMCERGHLWLRFCLHCPAIRKEEGRLSHTLGKVLARCWHTQPYPLSMARAKEGREKGERRAKEKPFISVLAREGARLPTRWSDWWCISTAWPTKPPMPMARSTDLWLASSPTSTTHTRPRPRGVWSLTRRNTTEGWTKPKGRSPMRPSLRTILPPARRLRASKRIPRAVA